ncbi:MAG TPA: glycosyltransferase family 2 protein [Pirellulales bacterium]|nr:glycosyltransferase family 2 protein [Pirellulales bacterium]
MSTTADLSVVIPTYNHAKYLPRALQALVTQSVAPAEIIVVNDASTDDTPAILEAFARDYSMIKVITNAQNRRTNESVRIGMAHATGKYIYCVASDDYVLPGFVEKMVGTMEANPQAGVCSAYFSIVNGVTGEIRPNPSGWCTTPRYFAPDEFEKRIAHSSIPGHASILKRSSFEAAGGLLPDLEWHSDWFLSLVVAFREGMCHVPEMLALLTDLPQSYCTNGMKSEKQLTVLNAIYDRLASREYADVEPAFRRSGVLSVFGPPVVRAAARRSDSWSKSTLGLINGLRTDEYRSLLDDPDPDVRELAAFFLGPFWHETEKRLGREADERREWQSTIAAQQQAYAALQETLAEREEATNHAKERLTEALRKLGAVNQLYAESEARRKEVEAVAMQLQEALQATESSHIWKFRNLLRDCKHAAIKQLKKAA